jgi:hypothetical protein
MKNNAKTHREIIAVIGIALLVAGITRTSRADDGRNFADQAKFTKIDVPGAAGVTEPFGINERGDIVGTYFAISNQFIITRGFLLSRAPLRTSMSIYRERFRAVRMRLRSTRMATLWGSTTTAALTCTVFC